MHSIYSILYVHNTKKNTMLLLTNVECYLRVCVLLEDLSDWKIHKVYKNRKAPWTEKKNKENFRLLVFIFSILFSLGFVIAKEHYGLSHIVYTCALSLSLSLDIMPTLTPSFYNFSISYSSHILCIFFFLGWYSINEMHKIQLNWKCIQIYVYVVLRVEEKS